MLLVLEDPCKDPEPRGFPHEVAYALFQPREDASAIELLDVGIRLIDDESAGRIVVFAAFRGRDYVARLSDARSIVLANTAEGYALVRCETPEPLERLLEPPWPTGQDCQEAVIAHYFPHSVVVFLHHSHDSIEIVGESTEVRRCVANLLGVTQEGAS